MRFVIPMLKDGIEHKMYFDHIPYTISDWIGVEEVKTWKRGDVVMICAGTGTGKSFFILSTLRGYFKEDGLRVLYLTPRVRINEQFRHELGDDSTIKVMSYQAVESILNDPNRSIGEWDVIIGDEAHYFTSDSDFNRKTDISFDWTMEQKKAIKIFLSATHEGLSQFLTDQDIKFTQYIVPISGMLVDSLDFFHNTDYIADIAEHVISSGSKAVFFIWSAQTAYDLHLKFKDKSLFLCSKYNKTFAKFMDAAAIERMIEEKRFDCQLLFATSALDSGVSLSDPTLNDMIIDIFDPITVKQCIGRKRPVGGDDAVRLHIRAYNNKQVGGKLRKITQQAEDAHDFIKNGAAAYSIAHDRGNDAAGIVHDVSTGDSKDGEEMFVKRMNEPKYNHIKQSIEMCKKILEHKDGYAGYVADYLGIDDYAILDEEQRKQSLAAYLDSISGKPMLDRKAREPFIERLDIRQNRRLCKDFDVISTWIEKSGLPYRLIKYRISRIIDGKKKFFRPWEVVKPTGIE